MQSSENVRMPDVDTVIISHRLLRLRETRLDKGGVSTAITRIDGDIHIGYTACNQLRRPSQAIVDKVMLEPADDGKCTNWSFQRLVHHLSAAVCATRNAEVLD